MFNATTHDAGDIGLSVDCSEAFPVPHPRLELHPGRVPARSENVPAETDATSGSTARTSPMNVYTDPRLLDVAGTLKALPELPAGGEAEAEVEGRVLGGVIRAREMLDGPQERDRIVQKSDGGRRPQSIREIPAYR